MSCRSTPNRKYYNRARSVWQLNTLLELPININLNGHALLLQLLSVEIPFAGKARCLTLEWSPLMGSTRIGYNRLTYKYWWSGNSSKRQLIETATHRMPIGVATHRMPFRGGNSSKKITHKSAHITHFRWVATPVATHRMPLRMATHRMPFRGSFHRIYHIWSSHLA